MRVISITHDAYTIFTGVAPSIQGFTVYVRLLNQSVSLVSGQRKCRQSAVAFCLLAKLPNLRLLPIPLLYNVTIVPANSFGRIQVHSSSTIGAQFFG